MTPDGIAAGPLPHPAPGPAGDHERGRVRQRTIAERVSCAGVGRHSGAPVRLRLLPALAGTGIVFVRTDGAAPVEIPARPAAVVSTHHATSLGRNGAAVATVEHLLAALYALGIDNVRVEVDGPEVPILDGSAASFASLIRSAGIRTQQSPGAVLCVRRRIEVRDGHRQIRVEPAPCFQVSYAVDFDHCLIGRQEFHLARLDPESFERDIAPARTFGFLREVHALRSAGLARGGSLDNTLVLGATKLLNPSGLRWPDEFVRHKLLDLLGDLALLGMPIRGHVHVERGGHTLHQKLVAAIVASPSAWRVLGARPSDLPDAQEAPLRASLSA